jgi:hypothetical protein
LFPLGPEEDAFEVMQTLGGPFDNGRWDARMGTALKRLLGTSGAKNVRAGRVYNVLVFQILIAPFTLRRTVYSTWDGLAKSRLCVQRAEPEGYNDHRVGARGSVASIGGVILESNQSIINTHSTLHRCRFMCTDKSFTGRKDLSSST